MKIGSCLQLKLPDNLVHLSDLLTFEYKIAAMGSTEPPETIGTWRIIYFKSNVEEMG